jgi:hypothetical protein
MPSTEHGVQIMSFHFESQPDRPVLVPKSKGHSLGDAGEGGPE